jgi:hypothetical protein
MELEGPERSWRAASGMKRPRASASVRFILDIRAFLKKAARAAGRPPTATHTGRCCVPPARRRALPAALPDLAASAARAGTSRSTGGARASGPCAAFNAGASGG